MNIPENFLSEFHSRTLLFARSAFVSNMGDEKYAERLATVKIAITGTRQHFESANGQYALLMLISLLSRFCLKIDIVFSADVKTVIKHPFISDRYFVSNLLNLARLINPVIDITVSDGTLKRYDFVVVVGDQSGDRGKSVFINSDGWIAYVNTESNSISWVSKNINPVGAYVAACMGAAELFKAIFAKYQQRPRIGSLIFSAFDYGFRTMPLYNPPIPPSVNINDINFISMGAINSAVLYTLCSISGAIIEASIVEPENLDVSNLNRYAFSLAEDAINKISKIDSALKFAGSNLNTKRLIKLPFEKITDPLDTNDLAVIGVDNVEGRWAVQRGNPSQVLCGGTTGTGEIQISTFSKTEEGACMGCLYPEPLPTGTIPTISFVSILSGVLMAGEIIKARVGDFELCRMRNNLNLSMLSTQYYQYRNISIYDCCPIHQRTNAKSVE